MCSSTPPRLPRWQSPAAEFLALASPAATNWKLPLAIALILGLLAINASACARAARRRSRTTALKVGLLLAIIAAAITFPAVPVSAVVAAAPAIGLAGVLAAYQLVYGAITGWITPVYFVEEDVAPGRNMPRSMMLSVLAVSVVYVALNLALLRAIPIAELGQMDIPVGELLGQPVRPLGTVILGVTGFVIILSCCNGLSMMGSRIVYGLARDGLFPRQGMLVNRGGTPWVGLARLRPLPRSHDIATGSFEAAFRLMGALTVVSFVVVDVSLFVLRRREPDLPRPFGAIGYPLLPAAGADPRRRLYRGDHLVRPDKRPHHPRPPRRCHPRLAPHRPLPDCGASRLNLHRRRHAAICGR